MLTVKYQGVTVKTYSLAQLQALTAFSGYAGFRSSGGTPTGPDAVTGVKITDIVADARGIDLTSSQAVTVAQTFGAGSPYSRTFSYDRLVNFTGFTMYNATSGNPVSIGSLTGPLASILAYSSTPAGNVMTVGTLRFFVADTLNENVVMTSSESVSSVDTLNVVEPTMTLNLGDGQSAPVGTAVATRPSVIVTDSLGNPVSGLSVTFAVASGGGSLTGPTTNTSAAGIATVGSWTLGAIPGTNTLTATSAGLAGSPVTFTATATALDLAGATIEPIPDQTYTGSGITPALSVTYGATPLVAGTDYTVGYLNNTNVGLATATITGAGAYSGTKSANFNIVKATPTVSVWPTASPINLGQALSASTLSGGTASVSGVFAFTTPATVPGSTGTYSASVTFTPTDTANYKRCWAVWT